MVRIVRTLSLQSDFQDLERVPDEDSDCSAEPTGNQVGRRVDLCSSSWFRFRSRRICMSRSFLHPEPVLRRGAVSTEANVGAKLGRVSNESKSEASRSAITGASPW